MKFNEALGTAIRAVRADQALTLRELSARSYVSMGHLSDVENGNKEASSDVIDSLAKGLGIPAYDLIIEAGYLMSDFEVPNTAESLLSAHSQNGLTLQM